MGDSGPPSPELLCAEEGIIPGKSCRSHLLQFCPEVAMTRKHVLIAAAAIVAIAAAAFAARRLTAQRVAYDVVIRGGYIVDGTGNPWFAGDVAI